MTDLHEGDDLAVELRQFTVPGLDAPLSGRELLEDADHDRDLLMLLLALRRGDSGRRAGGMDITRIW